MKTPRGNGKKGGKGTFLIPLLLFVERVSDGFSSNPQWDRVSSKTRNETRMGNLENENQDHQRALCLEGLRLRQRKEFLNQKTLMRNSIKLFLIGFRKN